MPVAAIDRPFDADSRLVETVLDEYGGLVRRHMQKYFSQEEPRSYLYELIADYPARGGKMMRPSLCIAMAKAAGGEARDALPSAVAIELLHNALLVHDDIQDFSDERRGRPTLHALHGVPLALNAGDALAVLSLNPLKANFHQLGFATALKIFDETERVAWESAEGQALELGWQRDNRTDLGDEDYLEMVLKKTCWLTSIHPLRVGCLIGARGKLALDPLIRIGFFFGAAFQIQDDLLNLDPGPKYGKEMDGDLFEGKRTLMIIHALRAAGSRDQVFLAEFLARERAARSAADVGHVRDILGRTGACEHARSVANGLCGAALAEFDRYFATVTKSRDHDFIRSLMIWVCRRRH
jgi:geranylgeranyl diphosphate synthase type II